jgi:hypothetical protein
MGNLQESFKVITANAVALGISFSNLESYLRIAGLAVAFLYTCLKIVQLLKNWKK